MKKIKLGIAAALLACILTLSFSACNRDPGKPDDTETPESNTGSESVTKKEDDTISPENEIDYIIKDGKMQYKLIRAEKADATNAAYATAIYSKISDLDSHADFSDDFISRTDTDIPERKEILFGYTNRPETAEVLKDLKYRDYAIVKSGNKIVITSPSPEGLYKATNYFINRVLYEAKEVDGKYELVMPENFIYRESYKAENISVGDTSLKDFKIVYASSNRDLFKQAATDWRDAIAENCGYILDIISDKEAETAHEILIGNTNRIQSAKAYGDKTLYDLLMQASVSVDSGKIVVIGGGAYSAGYAAKEFFNKYIADKKDINLTAIDFKTSNLMRAKATPLAEGADGRIMSANILAEFASWATDNTEKPIPARAEIFIACLEFYSPDAIGVQEVTPLWVEYLEAYFDMSGKYKIFGTKRQNDGGDNYSSLIYNQQKYELEAEGFKQYSRHASAVCRNMQWGIFKNKENGRRFGLVSTHWDFGNETNKVAMRDVQLKELSALVEKLSKDYGCTIMTTGDYNCSESSQSYKDFMAINKMQDSKFAAKKRYNVYGSCHTLGASDFSSGTIDCVFATLDAEVLGYMTVVENEIIMVSDHLPVFADIVLKK